MRRTREKREGARCSAVISVQFATVTSESHKKNSRQLFIGETPVLLFSSFFISILSFSVSLRFQKSNTSLQNQSSKMTKKEPFNCTAQLSNFFACRKCLTFYNQRLSNRCYCSGTRLIDRIARYEMLGR